MKNILDLIPDPAFRDYLRQNHADRHGILTPEAAARIDTIEIFGPYDIRSLEGLEYFPVLETLDCSYQPCTELDVSRNPALRSLTCMFSYMSRIDVSRNGALEELICAESSFLISLDLSHNPALGMLLCYGCAGVDGIFEVRLAPGTGPVAEIEKWKYDGREVSIRYVK